MMQKTFGSIATAVIAVLAVSGCNGQGGSTSNPVIDGVTGPTVSLVNNAVTISATLNNVVFEGGVTIAIPHTQNSYVEVGPDVAHGGMLLQIGLNLSDLKFLGSASGSAVLSPNELPGGRPLPGIVGGVLPSVAVEVPQWDDATFYVGSAISGVFIPVKFGAQGVTGTFLFYDNSGKEIGTISIVGSDSSGKNSGILLLLNISSITGSSTTASSSSVSPSFM